MENKDYLNKLHDELLDIMDEIDRVCTLCQLHYYLIGGTLLGAIRHKGFIPWDDDLDIAMPRSDFEVFVSKAKEYLSDCYELRWINTDKSYWHVFAKVCKKNTIFRERGLSTFQPTGIFVDIFPLDKSANYSAKLENKKKWIVRINSIIWAKNGNEKRANSIFRRMLSLLLPTVLLQKLIIFIAKGAKKYGQTHYANFGSQYSIKKQTMPVDWFGKGVNLEFAGKSFRGPVEYSKVLSSIFGPNYMELPPEEKRRCHYPEKVVFSDGEEMNFEPPKHIVTIQEQEK